MGLGSLRGKLGLMIYTVVVNGTTIYIGSKEECQSIALNLQTAGIPYVGMSVSHSAKVTKYEARSE